MNANQHSIESNTHFNRIFMDCVYRSKRKWKTCDSWAKEITLSHILTNHKLVALNATCSRRWNHVRFMVDRTTEKYNGMRTLCVSVSEWVFHVCKCERTKSPITHKNLSSKCNSEMYDEITVAMSSPKRWCCCGTWLNCGAWSNNAWIENGENFFLVLTRFSHSLWFRKKSFSHSTLTISSRMKPFQIFDVTFFSFSFNVLLLFVNFSIFIFPHFLHI